MRNKKKRATKRRNKRGREEEQGGRKKLTEGKKWNGEQGERRIEKKG